MKRRGIAPLLLIGMMLATGCAKNKAAPGIQGLPPEEPAGVYRRITAEEAHRMMGELESYSLVDVRTEEEFEEARIEGAMLIPDYAVADEAEGKLLDKDAVILVYCRTGRRSALAARQLIDLGYTKVYDFGGIIDWPYGTVSGKIEED